MERSPFLEGGLAWVYGGEPPAACPECGYRWNTDPHEAVALVASGPQRIERTLEGRNGMARVADGSWNATAYVWHLADLARSWAERWVQIEHEPGSLLVGFDPDELASSRGYRSLPTEPGLWALRTSVAQLVDTTGRVGFDTVFEHGDWGTGTVRDAMIWLGHEFHHHEQDIAKRAG